MTPMSKAALLKASAYSSPPLNLRLNLRQQHPRLGSLTLDTGVELSSLEKLSILTRSPVPGVLCGCSVRRDGGCMDESNCATTLQLVRVYGPAVAPCRVTLLGINIHSERNWIKCCFYSGEISLLNTASLVCLAQNQLLGWIFS